MLFDDYNEKYCKLLCILCILILIIYWFHVNIINFYKNYIYMINNKFYSIMDQIPEQQITVSNIPEELKDQILCMNIPDIHDINKNKNKADIVLDMFAKKYVSIGNIREKLHIYDTLSFSGAYFPTAHTDTEWNKVRNDGFQIWCLLENKNEEKKGNMFILYNEYLYSKYKDDAIFLRVYKGRIAVIRNCYYSEFMWYINPKLIYEYMSIDQFIRTTKKYYLDFNTGDTILFLKNTLHMSDYRDSSRKRTAFNFRIAIKENNKLKISNDPCGYVHNL